LDFEYGYALFILIPTVLQLHLMSAANIVGQDSNNSLYDFATRSAPGAAIGLIHGLYVTNSSRYNSFQTLNSTKARLNIPFPQFGECLHGVGSFKQSIGMAASFDTEMVHRVGSAIGAEARSIGIHACLSPVLDFWLEPRWGRGLSRASIIFILWLMLNSARGVGRRYASDKLYGSFYGVWNVEEWILGST
jgi:beta-glucosidase-like glycosyl hydrolase